MSKETLNILIGFCKENAPIQSIFNNGFAMPTKEMVYITIWYLANQSPIRAISLMFGRPISSIWRAVYQITIKILEGNQDKSINWPTAEQAPLISAIFKEIAGFPGVWNSITTIESFSIQLICLQFVCRTASFPIHLSDSPEARMTTVFRCSDLCTKMNDNPETLFPTTEYHILGDSAFPCT